MLVLNKSFSRISVNLFQIAKYSVHVTDPPNVFVFKSNFTTEEQRKVLHILNESNPNQLSRFNVSQTRIKNLETWKSRKGPFRTLNDVLEVEGLGEKVLEKICEKIINEDTSPVHTAKVKTANISKRLRQLVTPPLTGSVIDNLQSAVGIHLGPVGISWAKLSRSENKLNSWNYEEFSTLPKKMLPADTFDLAIKIIRKLPVADFYIFEANPTMSPQSTAQSATVSSYTQQLELTSMLIALINTSGQHNAFLRKNDSNGICVKTIENRILHLKSKIPARLFRTLVGTEKVSALTTVTELVENNGLSSDFHLPCTPITLEQQLRNAFVSQTPANKELLGQALMLVVSFMDLCIYKNPISLVAISPNKK